MTNEVAFVVKLVDQVPILRPILDEHLADYDEILSYLLIAEIARWAGVQAQIEPDTPSTSLKVLLAILERASETAPADIRDLIGAGFVEGLPAPKEPGGRHIRRMLGPALKREYGQVYG